jgi:hypothetical protein
VGVPSNLVQWVGWGAARLWVWHPVWVNGWGGGLGRLATEATNLVFSFSFFFFFLKDCQVNTSNCQLARHENYLVFIK